MKHKRISEKLNEANDCLDAIGQYLVEINVDLGEGELDPELMRSVEILDTYIKTLERASIERLNKFKILIK